MGENLNKLRETIESGQPIPGLDMVEWGFLPKAILELYDTVRKIDQDLTEVSTLLNEHVSIPVVNIRDPGLIELTKRVEKLIEDLGNEDSPIIPQNKDGFTDG